MANFKSKQVAQRTPALSALDASALVAVTAEYVTKSGDAIGDIVEMGAVPAGCIVVDVIVDNGALGTDAALDVGILSGNYGDAGVRTMGAEFINNGAAVTAGVLRRNLNANAVAVSDSDKSWGIKFEGANPATGQTIRATVMMKPAPIGI
jgi:hypothetical protein